MMLRGIVRCSRFGGYFRFSIQRPLTNTSKRSVFGQTRRNFCTSPAEQKDPSNLLPNQPAPSGPAFFTISRQLGIILLGIVGTLGYGYVEYGSIASAFKTWHTNAKRNFFHFNNPGLGRKFYLLPKVDSIHYTVVIDLKDLIEVIDDKETKKKRALMRPYMDVFLEELANQRYEIVIWSSLDDMSAPEWIEKLDKQVPCFNAVLYFSECTVDGGRVIKDLRRLNRDPKRVINICSSPTIAAYQPENALLIPSWSGDTDDDTTLLDIYMFFLYTAQHCNPITTDVRDLLKKFRNSDVAEAHREVQKQYHDQILQGNKKTKAFIAESKKQVAPKGPISI